MSRLPRATGQDVIKALSRLGFTIVRQRGSHVSLQHTDGRTTVVPVMPVKSSVRGYYQKYYAIPKSAGKNYASY